MADSIVRLRVDSGEYDSKIKRAVEGLRRMEDECRKVGGTLAILEKDQLDYVKGLGQMETVSRSARGRLAELNSAFVECSMQYKRLTDEEKKGDFGKALNASLEQLKTRITEAKTDLADVTKELGDTGVAGTDLTSVLQGLGNQFGINSNLMGVVTTGAIGYTAAITAAATATIAATKAWAEYNSELSKQTQITTVTTGLNGNEADRLTDFAAAVSKIYNVDFRDIINAANTLMTQFGTSSNEAMQLIRDGMQGMIAGDGPKLLSMIQQYAPSFRDAGIEASQLVAVIQNTEGGIFTDQNMNAIVMGIRNIRLMTQQTSDALAQLGINGQDMSRKLEDGSMTIFEALRQVSDAIDNVDSGSKAAGEVMQSVFGRQGTMAGTKLGEAIATLNTNLEETKRQTGAVGAAMANLETETERLNESIRRAVGYQGWDVMANRINSEVVGAIASVIGTAESLRETINDITGIDVFSTMVSSALNAIGPVGMLLDKLRQIAGLGEIGSGNSAQGSGQRPQMQNPLQGVVDKFNQKSTIDQKPVEDTKKQQTPTTNPPKPTTTTPTAKQTPETKAADIVKSAQEAYAQTMVEARLRMEAGMDDTLAYKKKELDAQQRMFEAYGKAYAVYASPEYKEAYDQATDQYKRMASELAKSTEEQKIVMENAKALEAAQKKLAEEERKVAEAAASGKYISKRAVNNARKEVERLTQIVDVKAGKVELPDIPKEVTVKVSADAKALEDAKKTLADAQQKLKEAEATGNQQNIYVSKRAVNNARKEVERLTQIVDVKSGKVELPDIPKEVEQVVNTKVGEVLTPDVAAEIVQTISTQLGDIITPEIADQLTQTINTKVGEVITPDIATELTQVVNVVTGDVDLPDIPKEVEQVVNTKVGEVLTPDIAAEIVQTISTQLGDIVTPEIADQLTQTINTKVGEVITPDIATELTQVVNVVTGDVDLPEIPKEKEVKVKFTQENLQALTADLKTQQQQAVVGSMDYTKITEQIADANALKNVMQTALQEGLDNVVIDSQKLFDQLLSGGIPDSVWEDIFEQMNAGMKESKSGKQYEFNAQTGDVKETKTATTNESVVGLMQKTAGGIGSIVSGVEGLGAEIPEGFKDVIGGINSAMTIMQGIASILAVIETLNKAESIVSFIPGFKNGGKVPHAATGLVVPGNDHSDHTLIAASSGEVILNRAQQSNLINDLDGAGRNVTVRGVIDGTTIRLVLDNTSRQMGKGTYVTSR